MTSQVETPSDLEFGFVADRVLLAVGDGADEDRYPDVVAATGTVKFTPMAGTALVHGGEATIVMKPIAADIDPTTGRLSYGGASGVWLVTGPYRVRYETDGGAPPEMQIEVTTAHTPETPLVLSLHREITPTPGVRLVVNEQLYRDTEALVDEARGILAMVEERVGAVPIFATLAEAQAWEAAHPGHTALTLEAGGG